MDIIIEKTRNVNLLRMLKVTSSLVVFLLFSIISLAHAYLEDIEDGSTKLTAGEQNTNMYKMTSQGKVALKKLKQIDEMMAKSPTAGDGSIKNVTQVAQIVDEQNDVVIRAVAEQARKTAQLLENKTALYQKNSGQAVQMIISINNAQARDNDIAEKLLKELARRQQ